MEAIKTTTNRIHPLMAAAAASIIVVSLVGVAAITGVLPSSHSAPDAALVSNQAAYPGYAGSVAPTGAGVPQGLQQVPAGYAQQMPAGYAQPAAAAYPQSAYPQPAGAYPQPAGAYPQQATAYAQPAPVVIKETVIKEVPAPRRHVVHHTSYARNDGYYAPAPRQAPQPNYIGIGTGAVIGGLIGNQVGGGNGKKLATVAGMIGGGMIGNQMINR